MEVIVSEKVLSKNREKEEKKWRKGKTEEEEMKINTKKTRGKGRYIEDKTHDEQWGLREYRKGGMIYEESFPSKKKCKNQQE